jgi:hypothetical protein
LNFLRNISGLNSFFQLPTRKLNPAGYTYGSDRPISKIFIASFFENRVLGRPKRDGRSSLLYLLERE